MPGYEQLNTPPLADIALPKRSDVSVPKNVFSLVNDAIKAAYPKASIPAFNERGVRVVNDSNCLKFVGEVEDRLIHSFLGKIESSFSDKSGDGLAAAVMPFLPNRPIFITESYMESWQKSTRNISDIGIAYFLLHERMHQIGGQKVIPINPEHKLFLQVGFADVLNKVYSQPEDLRDQATQKYGELKDFIGDRDPVLMIDGGIADLFCRDGDGKIRKLLANGYDFNEGLAEYLAETPRAFLKVKISKSIAPREFANEMIRVLESTSSASVQRRSYETKKIEKWMESLGFVSRAQTMNAFRAGLIPEKWQEKMPKLLYP